MSGIPGTSFLLPVQSRYDIINTEVIVMESTKFQKGHVPWNKGMKGFAPNDCFKKGHPQYNTGRTHFKKGHIPWSKDHKELMPEPWNKGLELGESKAKGLEFARLGTKALQNIKLDLSKIQCAYLAGFIDADGCIQINGRNGKDKKTWHLTVILYNCNYEALNKMRNWIGSGKVNCRNRNLGKWRKSYVLKYGAATAAKLIKKIAPYMLVKKRQAMVAMEFIETFKKDNYEGSSWQGGRKVKEFTLKKREQLKRKLQSLTGTANYLGKNNARIN